MRLKLGLEWEDLRGQGGSRENKRKSSEAKMILACLHRTMKTPLEQELPFQSTCQVHTLCINALHPYNSLIRLMLLPSSSWQK